MGDCIKLYLSMLKKHYIEDPASVNSDVTLQLSEHIDEPCHVMVHGCRLLKVHTIHVDVLRKSVGRGLI